MNNHKAFGLWSAIFLGIGSMVGAGIFIVIGQAGVIAGNLVWLSFVFGGLAALFSGYSLAKLAIRYPSRGGIVEYLVQGYGEGIFSGSAGVLFYFSQLIAIAAVAKSFGAYAVTLIPLDISIGGDIFAIFIITVFVSINLISTALVAKAENIIVFIKLTILLLFVGLALFYIDPKLLGSNTMPPIDSMFFAIGLTFFAYQGFSVITNTVEDMESPEKTMLKAMIITIIFVGILYVLTSVAVLGNMPLAEVVKAKDYALAQAAQPIFGSLGFKIMAATALLATASAINATLYSATEIGYTLAKDGDLPKVYTYNVNSSYDGLIISGILVVPMILFLDLSQITTIAALIVLIIQGATHVGHLIKIKETGANLFLVTGAVVSMFGIAGLTLYYTTINGMPMVGLYIFFAFFTAFLIEVGLRFTRKRVISNQIERVSKSSLGGEE